jgi:hypothetical protein
MTERSRKYSAQYDRDDLLMVPQGYPESQHNPSAGIGIGAIGVMQMMPAVSVTPVLPGHGGIPQFRLASPNTDCCPILTELCPQMSGRDWVVDALISTDAGSASAAGESVLPWL